MKTKIGAPARREYFYKRNDIRRKILEALHNGENLLLSAPRRVGKTSILFDLIDNPNENVFAVYINTEAIDDPERFFQMILHAILNADQIESFGKFGKNAKDLLNKWGNRIAEIKIAGFGVGINKSQEVSYFDQIVAFLTEIKLDGKQILMMIDEFPITIEHIQQKHGLEEVRKFLNQNRVLRQTPEFQDKIKFIYTGSIGLYTAVKQISATDRINDLREIKISALSQQEAEKFINELLWQNTRQKADKELLQYILNKIEWWIPFYFQLLVRETADLVHYDKKELSPGLVDEAFIKLIENGNIYFEHFKSRLAKALKDDELAFALALLLKLKQQPLSYKVVVDLGVELKVKDNTNDILEILKHDGYLVEEKGLYKFYSPILKNWWR